MLTSGTIVEGRFTLIRQLDRGGMGEIWVARESDTRDVALKFILSERRDPALIQRFFDEIRTAAQLHDPHVVRLYHWGMHDEAPYMVMELLHGQNLSERLRSAGRIQEIKTAVDYVAQVCAALSEAHQLGIVHRDLKPANLFVNEQTRQLKVLDFGVAKAKAEIRPRVTGEGSFVGTLSYSSPEQLAGADNVSARSDIWSLGATLYELLAGVQAFPEPYPLVLTAIQRQEPRELSELRPDVDAGLCECIRTCLAKEPERRYPDVETLLRELAPFGGSESRAIAERLQSDHDALVSSSSRSDSLPDFHSEEDLIEAALTPRRAPDGSLRRVVFMLGAGFSMPTPKQRGIPGTEEIVRLIKRGLAPAQHAQLVQRLKISKNKYQDAFDQLASTRSADVANAVIRKAVLEAFRSPAELPLSTQEQEKKCREYEDALDGWHMPAGATHLGRIIARGLQSAKARSDDSVARTPPHLFSQLQLTTNFDPLLAISTRRHGGHCISYSVDRDFEIPDPEPEACLIVHLHGRWNKGDTLHNNLAARRERLERSLGMHLERSVLVVLGYGGWDDVFTRTLRQIARSRNTLDVLWGFFSNDPMEILQSQKQLISELRQLGPRVQFYRGVDTNRFFERLASELSVSERSNTDSPLTSNIERALSSKPPRAAQAWAPRAFAVALALGLLGLFRAYVPSSAPPIGAPTGVGGVASPVPSAPIPAAPGEIAALPLLVQCAKPYPSGVVKLGGGAWPIPVFCSGKRLPGLLRLRAQIAKAELDAADVESRLFYGLEFEHTDTHDQLSLVQKARANVTLTLEGDDCVKIQRVNIGVRGLANSHYSSQSLEPPRRDDKAHDGLACDLRVELPREAFGKMLALAFEPKGYAAREVLFVAERLQVQVKLQAGPEPCFAQCRYIARCQNDPSSGPCDLDSIARVRACCSTVYPECRARCQ